MYAKRMLYLTFIIVIRGNSNGDFGFASFNYLEDESRWSYNKAWIEDVYNHPMRVNCEQFNFFIKQAYTQ